MIVSAQEPSGRRPVTAIMVVLESPAEEISVRTNGLECPGCHQLIKVDERFWKENEPGLGLEIHDINNMMRQVCKFAMQPVYFEREYGQRRIV